VGAPSQVHGEPGGPHYDPPPHGAQALDLGGTNDLICLPSVPAHASLPYSKRMDLLTGGLGADPRKSWLVNQGLADRSPYQMVNSWACQSMIEASGRSEMVRTTNRET
jgi:hypothetical protein